MPRINSLHIHVSTHLIFHHIRLCRLSTRVENSHVNTPLRPIHNTTFFDATCDLRHMRRAATATHGSQYSSCLRHPHAQVVLCTYTARAPRVETVLHLCMSHVAKVDLSSTSATGALRQLATARDRQFLVATRVSHRRKLYCESAFRVGSHIAGTRRESQAVGFLQPLPAHLEKRSCQLFYYCVHMARKTTPLCYVSFYVRCSVFHLGYVSLYVRCSVLDLPTGGSRVLCTSTADIREVPEYDFSCQNPWRLYSYGFFIRRFRAVKSSGVRNLCVCRLCLGNDRKHVTFPRHAFLF